MKQYTFIVSDGLTGNKQITAAKETIKANGGGIGEVRAKIIRKVTVCYVANDEQCSAITEKLDKLVKGWQV